MIEVKGVLASYRIEGGAYMALLEIQQGDDPVHYMVTRTTPDFEPVGMAQFMCGVLKHAQQYFLRYLTSYIELDPVEWQQRAVHLYGDHMQG